MRKDATSSLKGAHVLVVEDDDDTRDLLATIFEEAGAHVETASSAAEARAVLRRTDEIELLVSDIGMPGENGYTLIASVRAMKTSAATVPAIALTAYSSAADKAAALESGFDAHMGKPMDPEALLELSLRLVASARDSSTR